MPYINVDKDAFEWFQKARKITLKDGRKLTIHTNELIILMLNMWEIGNMGKQTSDCIDGTTRQFPQKIFEHYNGKFYRSTDKR